MVSSQIRSLGRPGGRTVDGSTRVSRLAKSQQPRVPIYTGCRARVGKHQGVELVRDLVRGVMAYAGERSERVGSCNEFGGAFGCHSADRVIGVAPDQQRRHARRPIGACRVPRARDQPIAAAIAGRLPIRR